MVYVVMSDDVIVTALVTAVTGPLVVSVVVVAVGVVAVVILAVL